MRKRNRKNRELIVEKKEPIIELDRYYLAYGSNLSRRGMARRCPGAKPLKPVYVVDAKLVFRGVADLVLGQMGRIAPAGLWKISAEHEAELDCYEGVKHGMYRKEWFAFGKYRRILCYVMNDDRGIYPPPQGYADVIREGYRDFRLDEKHLDEAIRDAYVRREHSLQTWTRRQKQRLDIRLLKLAPLPEGCMS